MRNSTRSKVSTAVAFIIATALTQTSLARDGRGTEGEGTPGHASVPTLNPASFAHEARTASNASAASETNKGIARSSLDSFSARAEKEGARASGKDEGLIRLAQGEQGARVAVDLPAQPLSTSLHIIADKLNTNILFDPEQVKNLQAPAIKGSITIQQALATLLAGTKLKYEYMDERTISLMPASTKTTLNKGTLNTGNTGEGTPNTGALRVAQNDGASGAQDQAKPDQESASADSTAASSQGSEDSNSKGIPEILVKGSRSLNMDIERTEDSVQPYVVFDSEQIERSMADNLEDFLKTRLPMNTQQENIGQRAGDLGGNRSSVNLRGLGTNQTLILVDGRRRPGVFDGIAFAQPDINGIPLASIERIEVLPSTAGGIYGGGATGGVINIITRRDYSGVNLGLGYGSTFDFASDDKRVDLSGGFSFNGGDTRIHVAATRSDSGHLLIADRDFTTRARALQFANNPNAFYSAFAPPTGYTSNIVSTNGTNLVLDGGMPLNPPRTYIPLGYAGVSGAAGAALVANAGQYDLNLPDDTSGLRKDLRSAPQQQSGSLGLRHEFTPSFQAFADFSRFENNSEASANAFSNSAVLAANAPNNPFTTQIRVSFPAVGVEFPTQTSSTVLNSTVGAIVRLPHDWSLEADYTWNRSRFEYIQSAISANSAGTTALNNGTLDVMRDLNAFPLDLSPYLQSPSRNDPFENTLTDLALRFSGSIGRLPGGSITMSGLLEHREEEVAAAFTESSGFITYLPSRFQNVNSAYLEARLPIVSESNAIPLIRELELSASIRRDEYDLKSPAQSYLVASRSDLPPSVLYGRYDAEETSHTIGLRYSPVEGVVLRGSYGTGFLPPAINQIASLGVVDSAGFVTDQKRGNVFALAIFQAPFGGNPNLVPEDSKSASFGAIFTPAFLPGMRLSVDYTRIEKTNEIVKPTNQDLVNLEDVLPPGRIVRAPLTPADIAAGYTGGAITFLDNTPINFSSTEVEAYDIQVDYDVETSSFGHFHFYTVATYEPHFARQLTPIAAVQDSVGFNNGQLEWRGNLGLTWQSGPLTLGWNARFFDSYLVYPVTANQAARDAATRNQGSSEISSQTYHDLIATYRFGESHRFASGLLASTQISFGFQNVFDESPPILATTFTQGGYSTYGDPRLRRFTLTIRTNFGRSK